jgi:enamine deaminase RidA (YjgF/YER057c/UK114 family)
MYRSLFHKKTKYNLIMRKFPIFLCLLVLCACNTSNSSNSNKIQESNILPKVDVEANLKSLNISLPTLNKPLANYVHTVRTGNLIFTAGKGSANPDGSLYTGKLGDDLTIEQGQAAARLAGIRLLAALQAELGDLQKVKRIVKVLGMVNSTPDFTEHSQVINGFSDLMVAVFGERGKHARSAVGMNSLPKNLAVEIEMIVEVED